MCSRVTALQRSRQPGFMGLVKKHLHIIGLACFFQASAIHFLIKHTVCTGKSWHRVPSLSQACWNWRDSQDKVWIWSQSGTTRALTRPFIQAQCLYPLTSHWVCYDHFCNVDSTFVSQTRSSQASSNNRCCVTLASELTK